VVTASQRWRFRWLTPGVLRWLAAAAGPAAAAAPAAVGDLGASEGSGRKVSGVPGGYCRDQTGTHTEKAILYSKVQYDSVQHNTVHHSTVQYLVVSSNRVPMLQFPSADLVVAENEGHGRDEVDKGGHW